MKKTTTSRQDVAMRRKRVVTEEWEEVLHSATQEVSKAKPVKPKPRVGTGSEIPLFAEIPDKSTPEHTTKSAYDKGKDFELAFADWLRTDGGYENIRIRKQVFGAATSEEPDVYASKTVTESKSEPLGRFFGIIGLLAILFSLYLLVEDGDDTSFIFFAFGMGLCLLSFAMMNGNSVDKQEHAWAECKHINAKVDKDMMYKLTGSVGNLRKAPSALWKPDTVMFAAFNGFNDSALAIARQEGIECYVPDGGGFRLVK